MEMNIHKTKLPKGKSYAMRSSVLQKALDEAGIDMVIQLRYSEKLNSSENRPFFSAEYILPAPGRDHELFIIRVDSVDSSSAKRSKMYMDEEVIPEFIEWAIEMLALPAESTKLSLDISSGSEFIREFQE